MKYVLISFVVIGMGLSYLLFPIPDNSSPEYHTWKQNREIEFKHQAQMVARLERPDFFFDELEIIEVGPGEASYSKWGHILLRFKNSGNTEDEDLTLGFLADFNDFPYSRYKSIFGGYTVFPKLDSLKNFRASYQGIEKRTMNHYILPSSPEKREKLLSVLRSWIKDPSLPGTYTFFYNNCVGLMNKLLFQSGLFNEEQVAKGYFPKDIQLLLKVSHVP